MLENKIELSGKHGFDIFLDIITDFDLLFIKQDYYNTSDYWYFFTTERITKKQEILDSLKRKKSLKTAYMTLVTLKDKRLSFFFAVKDYSVFYGFYDETNRYIYKVGKFKTTNEDFKKLYSKKCMKTIRNVIENSNLKNLKQLQLIKTDFHTLFDVKEKDIEILDERRIKSTYPIDIFKQEDRNEDKLRIYTTQWSRNFNWTDKCYYYVRLTDKYAHFYIKLKAQIQ
ncbi:MAG: hypothetical protein HPY57_14030 [Ignavibacteria bacterium]|nr:hypothetical protein [Ignavibacteria bacterium]